jgi:uncharacterized membrane protein YfcA
MQLALTGVCAGIVAGFFGIGAGTISVPVLVALGYSQRSAAATSLLAIVPCAASGVVTYMTSGNVDYLTAALLAAGMVAGAQIGTMLLAGLPELTLRWGFVGFMAAIGAVNFLLVPTRDGAIHLDVPTGVAVACIGIATGVLAGLIGIGGGVVVVVALTFMFGVSDITARGTSLLMMIPGAVSGSVRNIKGGLTDVRAGLIIGFVAVAFTPLGKHLVTGISPRAAAVSFGVYLAVIVVRSAYVAVRYRQESGER